MAEKPKTERGNPVVPEPEIPPAPVPSIVRQSMVPKPPDPVPRVEGGEEVEVEGEQEGVVAEVDAKPKGVITIKVFENSPYEVDFEGVITGSEIDIAWKAMMKEYRVWKHTLFKKGTEQKDGGV